MCNTFKHGLGDARNQLRALRPDLFSLSISGGVQKPLSGDDIYIEDKDFEECIKAIRDFLSELFGYAENTRESKNP